MGAASWLGNLFRGRRKQQLFTEDQLRQFMAFGDPGLWESLNHRSFGFSDGVKELDQDFRKYLDDAQGEFDDIGQCVDAIATYGSAAKLRVVEEDGDLIETPPDHIARFLKMPNAEQGFCEFWMDALGKMGWTGEAPMLGVLPNGEYQVSEATEELWVQRPDTLSPQYTNRRRMGKEAPVLTGWVLDVGYAGDVVLPEDAVIFAKRPNPRDRIRGLSPMKQLERKINWGFAALEANRSYLANGAFPGAVFTSDPPHPGDDEIAAFKKVFGSRERGGYTGAANVGRTLWLVAMNLKLQRLRDAPKDALMLDVLEIVRKAVRGIYKVPPFVLADVENANYSNSVEQMQTFYRGTVIPWNRLIVDAINASPFVPEGMMLQHDYSEVEALMPNRTEQSTRLVALKKARVLTTNEAREELGLAPVEGGDELDAEPVSPFALPARDDENTEDEEGANFTETLARVRKVALQDAPAARGLRYRAFLNRIDPFERAWARKWRGLFGGLRDEVLEEYERQVAPLGQLADNGNGTAVTMAKDDPVPDALGDLFDPETVSKSWMRSLLGLVARVYQRGAEDLVEEATGEMVPFETDDPRIGRYADEVLASRVRGMADSRLSELRSLVTKAAEEGTTIGELTIRLRQHFDDKSAGWAQRIARTETAALYNQGALAGMEDTGVTSKEWLSSRDMDVRPTHSAMDGTEVPVNGLFVFPSGASGPAPGQIDSAAESANCRCTLIAGEMA